MYDLSLFDPLLAVSFISTFLETILKYIHHMAGTDIYGKE